MLLLKAAEYLAIGLVVLLFVSQVGVPFFQGRPLFPMFRRESELERRLAEAREEQHEAKMERDLKDIRHQTEATQTGTNDHSTESAP
jgi:hypothetical protein